MCFWRQDLPINCAEGFDITTEADSAAAAGSDRLDCDNPAATADTASSAGLLSSETRCCCLVYLCRILFAVFYAAWQLTAAIRRLYKYLY